jgi:uncharacterized protein involved in exopolysaccharide biosynthesis
MFRLIVIRLLESYFRHRWLYLLPIVLMLGAAAAYIYLQEPLYNSEGVLHVQDESLINDLTIGSDNGFGWSTPAQAISKEITDLLGTDAFIRAMISQTDLESEMGGGLGVIDGLMNDVREAVWVVPSGDNQLIIAASYKEPIVTQQLVNAVVDNFVNWQINVQLSDSANAQDFFIDLTQEYKADLEEARQAYDTYLLEHPEPERGARSQLEQVRISRLESEVQIASDRYVKSVENEELARLAIIQAENTIMQSYFLVDAPKVPTSPETSLKSLVMNVAIFLVVGVLISCVGIVGGALLDRSFLVPFDVNKLLDLPVLALVPNVNEALVTEQDTSTIGKRPLSDVANYETKHEDARDPQPIS